MPTQRDTQSFVLQSLFLQKQRSLSAQEFKNWVIGYAQEISEDLVGEPITIEMDITRARKMCDDFTLTKMEQMLEKVMTQSQRNRFAVYHENGYVHLSHNKKKSGIEMLGDIIHELEHEKQYRGIGYPAEEHKLCRIARFYYTDPEESLNRYQSNYTEILARIAETNHYIQLFRSMNVDTFSLQDKQAFCEICEKRYHWMKEHLQQNAETWLLSEYTDRIVNAPPSRVSDIFPEIESPSQHDKDDLVHFLQNNARTLLDTAHDNCQANMHELLMISTLLRQQIAIAQMPPSQERLKEYAKELAEIHGIPYREQLAPHGLLRAVTLNVENFQQVLKDTAEHFSIAVLTCNSQQQLCVVFQEQDCSTNMPTCPPQDNNEKHSQEEIESLPETLRDAEYFDELDER